jgi:hypothetical protein
VWAGIPSDGTPLVGIALAGTPSDGIPILGMTKGKTMKTTSKTAVLVRVSGMILLGVAVSLAVLMLVYALQNTQLSLLLATVSWNG